MKTGIRHRPQNVHSVTSTDKISKEVVVIPNSDTNISNYNFHENYYYENYEIGLMPMRHSVVAAYLQKVLVYIHEAMVSKGQMGKTWTYKMQVATEVVYFAYKNTIYWTVVDDITVVLVDVQTVLDISIRHVLLSRTNFVHITFHKNYIGINVTMVAGYNEGLGSRLVNFIQVLVRLASVMDKA